MPRCATLPATTSGWSSLLLGSSAVPLLYLNACCPTLVRKSSSIETIVRTASLELQVLNTIQKFYVDLLGKSLGHAVPGPAELLSQSADNPGRLDSLRQWINLLDLAITAVMVRDALKAAPSREIA